MSTPIRIGFFGAGKIADVQAASVNDHPDAQVVAVQDIHEGRLKEFGAKFGVRRTYLRAEDLFADPEVDAVYVAVPNKFHAPYAIGALEGGKHVLLEKPFAMNVGEAEAVIAAAEKNGKALTLGMNMRFQPTALRLRQRIAAGELGEIYHAKAFWMRRTGIPRFNTWFVKKEMSGGGAIADIGVHMLDQALFLMDNFEPVSVTASSYAKFGPLGLGEGGWGLSERDESIQFDVDDFTTGFIRFANGATLTLDAAWACHTENPGDNGVRLFGTTAGADTARNRVFRPGPTGGYVAEEMGEPITLMPHMNRFHNFINHLLGKEDLCVTPAQALVVQRILDAFAQSAETGREVTL